MQTIDTGPKPNYYDIPKPLPEEVPSPELVEVVDLSKDLAPEGARRYVRTAVHVVKRPDDSTGYQVVNEMAEGVSLLPYEIVNNNLYVVMTDQVRYPHLRPGSTHPNLKAAAEAGEIGRWSREIVSGGVHPGEDFITAAVREAEEEIGVTHIDPATVKPLFPTLYGSVGINRQSFNIHTTQLEDGQWQPSLAHADLEEGNLHIAAHRIDRVHEMIDDGTVFELSATTAIMGLHRVAELRKYLP